MRTLLVLIMSVVLTSCATTGTEMQEECEAKFKEFPDIFQCTYENVVARNPRILQDARAKLYLLRGEQLAVEVLEKKRSSLDARVEWQKLFVQLKAAKDQEMAAALESVSRSLENSRLQMPQQSQTNRTVNCTSTKLGSSVYTTCQ